jgi:hypothetical protein
MTDLERLLKRSLRQAGTAHEPKGVHEARTMFVKRRSRRSVVVASASLALAALMVTTVIAAPWGGSDDKPKVVSPAPAPTAPPGEMFVKQTVKLDEAPSDLDFDGDELYVASAESRAIEVIDPLENRIWRTVDDFLVKSWDGDHPDSIDVIDVSGGAIRAISDDVLYTVSVERVDESVFGDTSGATHFNGPLFDLIVTQENSWMARSFSDSGEIGISRWDFPTGNRPQDRPDGRLLTDEPARLDYGLGYLWAAQSTNADWITRVDPESLERTVVPTPEGLDEEDSPLELSAGAGAVWTHAPDQLFRIDPLSAEVDGEWALPGHSAVLEATEDLGVFVMTRMGASRSRLYRIDPTTGNVIGDPMEFGSGPHSLESGFGSLWVADWQHKAVFRVEVGEQTEAQPEETGEFRREITRLEKRMRRLEIRAHSISEGLNFAGQQGELSNEELRRGQRRISLLEVEIAVLAARIEALKADELPGTGNNRDQIRRALRRELESLEIQYSELLTAYNEYGPSTELSPRLLKEKRRTGNEIEAMITQINALLEELETFKRNQDD